MANTEIPKEYEDVVAQLAIAYRPVVDPSMTFKQRWDAQRQFSATIRVLRRAIQDKHLVRELERVGKDTARALLKLEEDNRRVAEVLGPDAETAGIP